MDLWFEQVSTLRLAQAEQSMISKKEEEGKGNVNPKFILM